MEFAQPGTTHISSHLSVWKMANWKTNLVSPKESRLWISNLYMHRNSQKRFVWTRNARICRRTGSSSILPLNHDLTNEYCCAFATVGKLIAVAFRVSLLQPNSNFEEETVILLYVTLLSPSFSPPYCNFGVCNYILEHTSPNGSLANLVVSVTIEFICSWSQNR